MIGRKAAVGLSLLCALLLCAFAAQTASAAKAINTTAFTCIAKEKGDFEDEHCDKKVTLGTGKFGHVPITAKNGETTKVTVTNEKTANKTTEPSSQLLKGSLAGATVEITCKKAHGTGELHNIEHAATKEHTVTGIVLIEYTGCEAKKPAKCTVKEPIEVKAAGEGVEGLGAGKNEMGAEYKPEGGGKTFTTITPSGAECALKETPLEVQGTAIATGGTATQTEKHGGATSVFTTEMTKGVGCEKEVPTSGLCIGGKAAEFSGSVTTVMDDAERKPLSVTTVT